MIAIREIYKFVNIARSFNFNMNPHASPARLYISNWFLQTTTCLYATWYEREDREKYYSAIYDSLFWIFELFNSPLIHIIKTIEYWINKSAFVSRKYWLGISNTIDLWGCLDSTNKHHPIMWPHRLPSLSAFLETVTVSPNLGWYTV